MRFSPAARHVGARVAPNRCSQTNGRAQRTASNPSGKSALRAAPRFYQRSHRDGAAVAMTTHLCFVSRVAAGVTAIASSEAASYPCPQQNRRTPRRGVLRRGVGNLQPPARASVQAAGIDTRRAETKARSLAMKARPAKPGRPINVHLTVGAIAPAPGNQGGVTPGKPLSWPL